MNLTGAAALSPELGSGITISGLTKKYRIGRETLVALEGANLHSNRGSFLSLLGPSGCGKSTILRILAGLETATEGFVTVDGKSPAELRKNHELGIAFQDSALMPWRSVIDNIRLPLELSGVKPDANQVEESNLLVCRASKKLNRLNFLAACVSAFLLHARLWFNRRCFCSMNLLAHSTT
jgi:NitT/TauT family transport system ATP-binding protein